MGLLLMISLVPDVIYLQRLTVMPQTSTSRCLCERFICRQLWGWLHICRISTEVQLHIRLSSWRCQKYSQTLVNDTTSTGDVHLLVIARTMPPVSQVLNQSALFDLHMNPRKRRRRKKKIHYEILWLIWRADWSLVDFILGCIQISVLSSSDVPHYWVADCSWHLWEGCCWMGGGRGRLKVRQSDGCWKAVAGSRKPYESVLPVSSLTAGNRSTAGFPPCTPRLYTAAGASAAGLFVRSSGGGCRKTCVIWSVVSEAEERHVPKKRHAERTFRWTILFYFQMPSLYYI